MITCPWCGTNYLTFQSNCQNCGGPITVPAETAPAGRSGYPPEASLQAPPPAPRPISDQYARRLLVTDGWAIAGLVLALLGGIFSLLGTILTVAIVTAFVGIPFALTGLPLLAAGAGLTIWRYQEAQKTVEVLRSGEAVLGQITRVEQNWHVRVNMRYPWVIEYQFSANGQTFDGQVSTFNTPGTALQPGRQAYVLYSPLAPGQNVLYPHP